MEIDHDKIDEAALAVMWLTLHDERRAWNSFDWDVTDRLYQKGLIFDPANKTKSVVLTDEGLLKAEELFKSASWRDTSVSMTTHKPDCGLASRKILLANSLFGGAVEARSAFGL